MNNACFFSTYSIALRKKNKFPNIDTSTIDHDVAQWGFSSTDFGVEVCLFCFKLIGHWLILDATNKTHQNV